MPLTENETKTRAAWRTLPKSYWPLCPFVISRQFIKPAKAVKAAKEQQKQGDAKCRRPEVGMEMAQKMRFKWPWP